MLKTYTKFLVTGIVKSFLNVFFVMMRLVFFLNILKEIEIENCYKDNPRNIYKELIKRLINPFYLPVLILISLLLILNSKENLKYNKNKYLIFFTGFIIIILSESALGYISDNLIKNISISILPIILSLIFYLVFVYKLNLFYRKV